MAMAQYDEGYIKLNRSFLKWEWYTDINMRVVFIHCLLSANWQDKKWRGIVIKKGSFVTSRTKFAKKVGLTPRQVYRCWEKLEATGEITKKGTSEYTLIIVNNWDKFQSEESNDEQRGYSHGTTKVQPRYTTKEYKEYKEIDRMKIDINNICQQLGFNSISDDQYRQIVDIWLKHYSLENLQAFVKIAKEHNAMNLFAYVNTMVHRTLAPITEENKESTKIVDYNWWNEEDE